MAYTPLQIIKFLIVSKHWRQCSKIDILRLQLWCIKVQNFYSFCLFHPEQFRYI